jgi:hypothetical protein
MTAARWRWRGTVALTGVALALVIYPLTPQANVINSDWPAFATGARLALQDPGHLYDCDVQLTVQLEVTGGASLVTPGICGILPFLAPAWVALVAVPFEALGTDLGGRLWILFELACLAVGLWLAGRPRTLRSALPAFATAPAAIMMLNAQLDGLVALGLGAAFALWSRPYLAGLALGLTLMKPQLVLPLGAALLVAGKWRVLAGWAAAGLVLWASFAVLNPRWVLDWLAPIGTPVRPFSREVDLPHFATLLPVGLQLYGVALLTTAALVAVVLLARRLRADFPAAAAVLVAGGVLAAPHALPADLVLVAVALAIFGRAAWHDWLILSVAAIVAGVAPAPVPAVTGLLLIGWLLVRVSGLTGSRPALPQASTG